MRPDSFLLGVVTGVGGTLFVLGVVQMLVTKGYVIAVELMEAGWHPRELRAHRKAAVLLPFIQTMREQGKDARFGSSQ